MIRITENRTAALRAGWIALKDSMDCEGYEFPEYDVKALSNDKEVIGILLYKGPEVHVAILPQYRKRWLSRRLLIEIFKGILDKYGYATTMGFERDRNFLERLGFKEQFKLNEVIYYRMTP